MLSKAYKIYIHLLVIEKCFQMGHPKRGLLVNATIFLLNRSTKSKNKDKHILCVHIMVTKTHPKLLRCFSKSQFSTETKRGGP